MIMTTQAFTSPSVHGANTVKRLIDTVANEPPRQFWVVIDEVLGSEGGMHVVAELMKATQKWNNLRLVVMDANLRDGETLDFLIQDVLNNNIIPPQVIIRHQLGAIPDWVEIKNNHYIAVFGAGYPASQVRVRVDFYEGDPIVGIVAYAKAALNDILPDAQVYIYIQNREQVKAVAEALKDLGDVVALTSMDEVKGVEARVQTARFVVSTATTSRGIDASPRGQYCLMVFPLFNEEAELAEVGQVMSRLRGDKRFDHETKIIHGLFVAPVPIPEQQARKIKSLAQYYMEESSASNNPLDERQARIVAKAMDKITELRHRQGLARLFKGVLQTFIAPERQTITPIRLLHAPVMRQTLPLMLNHAIKAVMDAENLGIPDWPKQDDIKELTRRVTAELGQDIPIPSEIKQSILQGQGLFYWPFALVNTKTEGRAWIGRRKVTREFIELAEKLAEWRRKHPDLRTDDQLESALDYLDKAKDGAVGNVETDVAIYIPWLIACRNDPNPPIVKYTLPTVFGRHRMTVVRVNRYNLDFSANDGIMAFSLATPGAIEQLKHSHGVVRMPLDWI